MDLGIETSTCGMLAELFQHVIQDMKSLMPLWEEFIVKTNKLSISLRSTVASMSSFLDTLQKIADIATGARGATKEIGSGLTRLCLRHRGIENKLKAYNSGLLDAMVAPIQEKLEDWKKSLVVLDKDHSKDQKKTKQELRKLSAEVISQQNKIHKGKTEAKTQLNDALRGVRNKTFHLEEFEKSAVRTALTEERTRFCLFISCLKPAMDMELSLLTELTHVQEVIDSLCMQAGDPSSLPTASEQVILDILETKADWFCQSPSLSKNSSFQSINSCQSSPSNDSSPRRISCGDAAQSSSQNLPFTIAMSSVSDDSGFAGQDLVALSGSNSEKWTPVRQRSWTGIAQTRSSREASTQKMGPTGQIGSVRIRGRKKCPDINMVDDLPLRPSTHAHSLPPTPNPYAVPSLLNRMEGNSLSLEKFSKNCNDKSLLKGVQHQRMTVNLDGFDKTTSSTGTWTSGSLTSSSSTLMNYHLPESDHKYSDSLDVNELAAAMQELEWTTAMLDSLSDSSHGAKVTVQNKDSEKESQVSNNDGEPLASRNLSKPPISGILRRSSMHGGRKPPPPIRRTSSMAGSPQNNCQCIPETTVSVGDNQSPHLEEYPVNNHEQKNSHLVSLYTEDNTSAEDVFARPSCTPATLSLPPSTDGKDVRHGNGRKIPRINRMLSQPFGKHYSEEERFQAAQKERSHLPRRSLSDTHAEIIQTLNEQFSTQPSTALSPSEKYPTRFAAGNNAGKISVPGKPSMGRSTEASLSQIPEGVMTYEGLTAATSAEKMSQVRHSKKSS